MRSVRNPMNFWCAPVRPTFRCKVDAHGVPAAIYSTQSYIPGAYTSMQVHEQCSMNDTESLLPIHPCHCH